MINQTSTTYCLLLTLSFRIRILYWHFWNSFRVYFMIICWDNGGLVLTCRIFAPRGAWRKPVDTAVNIILSLRGTQGKNTILRHSPLCRKFVFSLCGAPDKYPKTTMSQLCVSSSFRLTPRIKNTTWLKLVLTN
jgi:hypothetical protein